MVELVPEPTRRFYVELVGYRVRGGERLPAELLTEAGHADALDALAHRAAASGVHARLAVLVELSRARRARQADAIARLREALAPRAIGLDVWAQMPDDATRFLNTTTVGALHAELIGLLDALGDDAGVGLALDVEPPQALMDGASHLVLGRDPVRAARGAVQIAGAVTRTAAHALRGRAAFTALGRDLARRGLPVHVAVLPPFSRGRAGAAARGWLLGCPSFDGDGRPLLGRPAPMCYGSMLRIAGGRRREAERRTLRRWVERHVAEHGARDEPLAVALGLLSRGVLQDEPVYERLDDIAEDLALAREHGVHDVAFFSWEGLVWGPDGVPPDDLAPLRSDWRVWLDRLVT